MNLETAAASPATPETPPPINPPAGQSAEQKAALLKAFEERSESADSFCRQRGVHKVTLYKWARQFKAYGMAGLEAGAIVVKKKKKIKGSSPDQVGKKTAEKLSWRKPVSS